MIATRLLRCCIAAASLPHGWVMTGCAPAGRAAGTRAAGEAAVSAARVVRRGDRLQIRLPDFVAEGVVSEFKPLVDDAGRIELPQLGRFDVEGRTLSQVADAIIERAPYALVYPIDAVPTPDIEFAGRP